MINYSHVFSDRDFVESVVNHWRTGKTEFILHSSGTQGPEKSISLSRKLLEWSVKNTKQVFHLGNEKLYCCLPVKKTGGFMMLIRALYFNWDIYFDQPSSSPFKAIPTDHEFTLCSLSPQQLQYAMNSEHDKLFRFKTVLLGGAPLSPELEKELMVLSRSAKTEFIVTYGMTETASHIAYRRFAEQFYTAIDGVELSLSDQCLAISIDELNLQVKTNDLAEINGRIFKILGRADHVINSGGIKIFPQITEPKIAELLQAMGIHRPFYISSINDNTLGERCILIMEGIPMQNTAFILEALKRELPKYQAPSQIIFKDHFSYTDTGKLRRLKVNEY